MRPKVKVLIDDRNGRAEVVDARHGEQLPDSRYTFDPVPLAVLSMGYNRPMFEVVADANAIAAMFNAQV